MTLICSQYDVSLRRLLPMQTLLILDDELPLIKLLVRVLKDYNLIEATGAEQALQLFIVAARSTF